MKSSMKRENIKYWLSGIVGALCFGIGDWLLGYVDPGGAGGALEKAKAYNRDMVSAGRCIVQQGDVSKLELAPEAYGLATAFESIYFWPGLERCFAQVAQVLSPGGCFLICNEGTDAAGTRFEKIIDGMKVHTAQEIEAALQNACFTETKTYHHTSRPWITVIARK